jgi:hypothetical protein
MPDFTKLASFLDSFDKESPGYDAVCYIKSKLGQDLQDPYTFNNADEENLEETDITSSTPDQQASKNDEGELMHNAFQELDAMNKIEDQKKEVPVVGKNNPPDGSFGAGPSKQNLTTIFQQLQKRLKS